MFQEELRGKSGYLSIPINPQNMVDGVPTMIAPEKALIFTPRFIKTFSLPRAGHYGSAQYLHTHPVSGKLHKDALTGYAVAMEVDTGNVVAMASMPDYDSNVRVNGGKITQDVVDSSGNRTITIYGSGRSGNGFESMIFLSSVIKPLTVLIGLNEGLFGINDTYPDQGYATIGREGSETRISNSGGHRKQPHQAAVSDSAILECFYD